MGFKPSQLEGEHLDQYVLERFIARGAMGLVYVALDTVLNREVALKLISKTQDITPGIEEARKRLLTEAQAAARLSHNNIVTVHGYGETEEYQYIAMEYVVGRTLEKVFRERGILPPEEVVPIALQVLNALDEAAGNGIVHRDIKPSNIMMTDNSRIVVMDFGIARLESGSGTATGAIIGTPHYMSPEQVKGAKADIRSDLFSLGAVLYEAVTGVRPFDGSDYSTILYRIVHEDPMPPRKLNGNLPGAIQFIVQKALAKNPRERYQTPAQMKDDVLLFTREPLRSMSELESTVVDQKRIGTKVAVTSSSEQPKHATIEEPPVMIAEPEEPVREPIKEAIVEEASPDDLPRYKRSASFPWKLALTGALGTILLIILAAPFISRITNRFTVPHQLPTLSGEQSSQSQKTAVAETPNPPVKQAPKPKATDVGSKEAAANEQRQDSKSSIIAAPPEPPQNENPRDLTELGHRYLTGEGVPKDTQFALRAFTRAAELGDAEAQYELGIMYEYGYAGDKNPKAAIQWYELAAERGNAEAQNRLGLAYFRGVGITSDYGKAAKWLKKAVDQENLDAAINLGYLYKNGYGVQQNYGEMLRLYRKAAEGGNPDGQNSLGHCYLHGIGLPQDYKMALDWFSKAAEQGSASAQCNLGFMYENGTGVPADFKQAMQFYQKAAEQDNLQGQYALGRSYFDGIAGNKDYALALEWLTKAANKDHAQAQYLVGVMYENGYGASISRTQAIEWYKRSAEKGNVNAQNKLKTLAVATP